MLRYHFFLMLVAWLFTNLNGQDLARAQEREIVQADKNLMTLQLAVPTRLGDLEVEIHYPSHSSEWAQKVAEILTQDAPRLIDYFDWLPDDPIHFTLVTDAKSANGFASAFPRNHIGLFAQPPTGKEHLTSNTDFQRGLVVHELTHILHMDQSRGLPKAVRSLFGSVGKWNGITPRWFSEGIAVWAETQFTSGGRLKDKTLDFQLKTALFKKEACRDLGCLDNPKNYPYQTLAYWAGAHFIKFLENKKQGAIRCVLAQNSRSLPFFLNDAFNTCLGDSAENLFVEFKRSYLNVEEVSKKRDLKGVRILDLDSAHLMLDAGSFFSQNLFVHLQRVDQETSLVVWDVIKNKEIRRWRYKFPIAKIMRPSAYDREKGRFIIGTKGHHNEGEIQRWYGVNLKDFAAEEIEFPGMPTDVFRLSDQSFAGLIFHKNKWEVRLWDRTKNDSGNLSTELHYQFDFDTSLFSPFHKKDEEGADQLVMQAHVEGSNLLLELNLNQKQVPNVIYESPKYFQIIGMSEDFVAISEDKDLNFVGSKKLNLPSLYRPHISSLWWQELDSKKGLTLFTDNRTPGVIKLALVSQKKQQKNTSSFNGLFSNQTTPSPKITYENKISHYPSLRHFRPEYWAFGIGGNEYLTRYDASTSLNDPFDRHVLNLNASTYSEIDKNGGALSYTLNLNNTQSSIYYDKSYTVRGAGRSVDTFESYGLSFGLPIKISRWSYQPIIYLNKQSVDDFISSRDSVSYGLRQSFSTKSLFFDSFWQQSFLELHHYRQKTRGFDEFPAQSYKWINTFRIFDPLQLHTTFAFSQLLKKGLRSGVLYGGGNEALYSLGGFHEFYGLEYGDLISNRITTLRAQLDGRIYESYRGSGLTPFYLKTIKVLAGVEYAHASNIFIDGNFISQNEVYSLHSGLSFNIDAFYSVPLSLDTIYARVRNPEGADQERFLFLIRGQIFP